MRNIIRDIFGEMGFRIDNEILKENDGFYAERTLNNKFDFYVVLFKKAVELNYDMNDEFSDYLNVIVENKQNVIGLDKNLSLLILLEYDSQDQQKLIDPIIFDIEEDPYDFKKYVLVYSLDEVEELRKNIHSSGLLVTNYIGQKIFDSKLFSAFKKGVESTLHIKEYQLITKLYIKLPFLNIKVVTREILDLSKSIKEEIQEEDTLIWNQLLIMSDRTDQIDDDIEKLEEIIDSMEEQDVE